MMMRKEEENDPRFDDQIIYAKIYQDYSLSCSRIQFCVWVSNGMVNWIRISIFMEMEKWIRRSRRKDTPDETEYNLAT